ncbi:hypothetical protein Bbelb_345660 [Branchiostoma belcheri]|nr:hypothetical protein Bbelb_345660 [Branchiostoma belcheri]
MAVGQCARAEVEIQGLLMMSEPWEAAGSQPTVKHEAAQKCAKTDAHPTGCCDAVIQPITYILGTAAPLERRNLAGIDSVNRDLCTDNTSAAGSQVCDQQLSRMQAVTGAGTWEDKHLTVVVGSVRMGEPESHLRPLFVTVRTTYIM